MPHLPAEVREAVAQAVDGEVAVLTEHAYPGAAPTVWEIADRTDQRFFVKRLGAKGFQREVHAYQYWTDRLEESVPRLLISDEEHRTVVVTAVPGSPASHQRLDREDEAELYRQSGELLARLHSAVTQPPTDATAAARDWPARAERALHEATPFVPAAQLTVLRRALASVPPALPHVAAHGDYQPRNWMWEPNRRRLYVIDFERATTEPAVQHDLVRMEYRILTGRTDLREAFYAGYGRDLTADEQRACRPFAALDAIRALVWGHAHHEPETIGYGKRMVTALATSDTGPPRAEG